MKEIDLEKMMQELGGSLDVAKITIMVDAESFPNMIKALAASAALLQRTPYSDNADTYHEIVERLGHIFLDVFENAFPEEYARFVAEFERDNATIQ